MQLHEEIGPRATTISAIAERAGVQRLTVYRHFPDENAVFQACTAHWLELNPPPDPDGWAGIDDANLRFRTAISAFYDYYGGTRRMWTTAFRDVDDVSALQQPMAEVAAFMNEVADGLLSAFGAEEALDHLAPTIRHALHFTTWLELEGQRLGNAEKVDLVAGWVSRSEEKG